MATSQPDRRLSEIAAKPTFRTIDGVSIRFVESDRRDADALLLSPMRDVQSYPTELEALRDVLAHTQTPVQIISGRRDAVVPLVNAEYLHGCCTVNFASSTPATSSRRTPLTNTRHS